jgi:cytochrome c-type biogenesis protein CcmH
MKHANLYKLVFSVLPNWLRYSCATLMVLLLTSNTMSGIASEAQPLAQDPVIEARLVAIADELRCLVCQNESLASSRADLAEDLRREVRTLIVQGKSDEDIKKFLVDRYGDFVLYRPQFKPATWLLWLGPFILLFVGVIGLLRYLKNRNQTQTSPKLSQSDLARVQHWLKD